jgi:hypothetical protein
MKKETEEQCLLKKYHKMYGEYTFNSIVSEKDLFHPRPKDFKKGGDSR